jgi:hypothetical protein
LRDRFGDAAPGDRAPPTLTWRFPPEGRSPLPLSVPLRVDATDAEGPVRVEVYVNAELAAALDAPPFLATVDLPAGQSYLTVEAIDGAANRTHLTRSVTASASQGPLCPSDPACSELTAPSPMSPGPRGCAAAPGRPPGGSALLALFLLLLGLRTNARWRKDPSSSDRRG